MLKRVEPRAEQRAKCVRAICSLAYKYMYNPGDRRQATRLLHLGGHMARCELASAQCTLPCRYFRLKLALNLPALGILLGELRRRRKLLPSGGAEAGSARSEALFCSEELLL